MQHFELVLYYFLVTCLIILLIKEKKKLSETVSLHNKETEALLSRLKKANTNEEAAHDSYANALGKWEKERQNMLNQIGSQNQSIIKLEATVKSLRNSLDAKGRRHSRHPNNNHKTKAST